MIGAGLARRRAADLRCVQLATELSPEELRAVVAGAPTNTITMEAPDYKARVDVIEDGDPKSEGRQRPRMSATTSASRRRPVADARPSRQRQPIHPGEILREDVLPELRLSVAEAARQVRVSRPRLQRVLSGRSAVTAEMALRLGRFCGNGPDLWLRMQQAHDLWRARERLRGELDKIPQHAAR